LVSQGNEKLGREITLKLSGTDWGASVSRRGYRKIVVAIPTINITIEIYI